MLREAAAEIEEIGVGALWFPEIQEAFAQGAVILSATSRLIACTSIANIYARDASAAAGGANTLAEAFGGRFVLGLGSSHRPIVEGRGHAYRGPYTAMVEYLDAMDETVLVGAIAPEPAPRLLAALGPRMLRLAADRSVGAHSYCVPVAHTAAARETMGQGPLLCVEQGVVLTEDREVALAAAGRYLEVHLGLEAYRSNLLRLGWSESQLTVDTMLDELIVWGDEDTIAERVGRHLEAGADHVCVQPLPSEEPSMEMVRRLLPALLSR